MHYLVLIIVCYLIYQYMSRNKATNRRNYRARKEETVIDIRPEDYSVEISPLPYQKNEYLLSTEEKALYDILVKSLEGRNINIFCKVSLLALFSLPDGLADYKKYLNKIKDSLVDFLICDNTNAKPIAAIMLSYTAKNTEENQPKEQFQEQVFKDAGLPILRIPARPDYVVDDIRSRLYPYL